MQDDQKVHDVHSGLLDDRRKSDLPRQVSGQRPTSHFLRHYKNSFPYNEENYDSKYINKKVWDSIGIFCKRNKIIKNIYAKGSVIYGCMIKGSDLDHVRIRVSKKLSLNEKKKLVDKFEKELKKVGVCSIKRIRENNYARVFLNWSELKNLPRAKTKEYEIFPKLKVITARDRDDWFKKILEVGTSYTSALDFNKWVDKEVWVKKMRRRIYDVHN